MSEQVTQIQRREVAAGTALASPTGDGFGDRTGGQETFGRNEVGGHETSLLREIRSQ